MKKMLLALLTGLAAGVAGATDYYWNTNVTEGNWSDAANWFTDAAQTKPATAYPKSTADTVHFVADTTATITMTETLTIKDVNLSAANLTLTFKGGAGAKLTTSNAGYGMLGAGARLVLDGFAFKKNGGWTLGEGASLALLGGTDLNMGGLTLPSDGQVGVTNSALTAASITLQAGAAAFRASGSTITLSGGYAPGEGTTFELDNGSQMTAGASSVNTACFFTLKNKSSATFTGQYSGGGGATVTIDDSTLWGKGFFYLGYGTPVGNDRYVFKGANPKMIGTGNYFRGHSTANTGSHLYFDFEVPVGGFAEPPVQNFNGYSSFWMNGTGANNPVHVRVLASSPALASTEYVTECALVYSPYGILRSIIALDPADKMRYASADGATAANSDATAKAVFVTLGSGSTPAPQPAVEHSTGAAGRAKTTVSRRAFTIASDVVTLATENRTRARLLVGETKTDLADAGVSVDVTKIGEFTLGWSAPAGKLNNTYYFQVVLETLGAGDAVVYTESSPVVSGATADTTIYTWQAVDGVWDGVWSDRAHWVADTGDDRLDYPQTTSCQMKFPADVPVTVTVDRPLTVGKLKLDKDGVDVTLVNADGATIDDNPVVLVISCDGTYAASLTVRNLNLKNNDNTFPGNGKTLRFENSHFWTGGYYQATGTTKLYLKDSTCSIGSHLQLGGAGLATAENVVLDNSQMTVSGDIYPTSGKCGRIVFRGKGASLYSSNKDKRFYSNLAAADAVFAFEIPEGGYDVPPITCGTDKTKQAFDDTLATYSFNFVILPTSPALLTPGDTDYPLMTWAKGITKGRVNFSGVVSETDSFLYGDMTQDGYGWEPVGTATLATPTAIGVRIHGLNSPDMVTVQGNPGDFGVAAPAYGKTVGHVSGETETYSVPEPVFTQDGVNYAVSGYVVSNVLEDLTCEYAYEGTGSSFEYTHPDNSTVVTWKWGRSFELAVSAQEGGSVTPTSKICAEGSVVDVEATADDGYVFFKWTGDTEGLADVSAAKIAVPMDRARTLVANFGRNVTVDSVEGLTSALASVTDGSTITVAQGEYQLTAGIYLDKAVKVVGATGNPEDVIIYGGNNLKTKVQFQVFTLNHPDARIEALTISDAYLKDNYTYGAGIRIAAPSANSFTSTAKEAGLGGAAVNCIVRNASYRCKFCNAAVYVNAANGLVDRCVVTNNLTNRQGDSGGGVGTFVEIAGGGLMRNSLIADNSNTSDAGAASVYVRSGSSLVNCTVANNSVIGASAIGGVQAQDATARVLNCAIAGNTCTAATLSNASWGGNASSFVRCAFDKYAPNDGCYAGPGLGLKSLSTKDYHPVAGSACLDWGVDDAACGTLDLEGNPRVSGKAVDVGCYEFDASQFSIGFVADVAEGFAPLTVTLTPTVYGAAAGDSLRLDWDFDADGTVDQTTTVVEPVTHTYQPGEYAVRLTVENLTQQKSATLTVPELLKVGAKVLYVKKDSANPVSPFVSVDTAAANVQDAVDAALEGAEVRILDGDYQLTKAIVLEKQITLTSDSGNRDAVILRGGRQRQYSPKFHVLKLDAGPKALVHSLTLADGITSDNGDNGGCVKMYTKGGTISNCVVTGGAACYKTAMAGGIYASGADSLVTHCILSNNFAQSGYSDGASASGSAIALFSGARCEHSLITRNVMGSPNGGLSGIGPSQNTVHVGADAYLRFCTVVSNAAYCVAGVNVESAKAHVEYCVISGNHSIHADATTYNGAANGGVANAPSDQVGRWGVWGAVGGFGSVKSGAAATAANRDDYVCTQERTAATAAVAGAFVGCLSDTVKINDACWQEPSEVTYRNLSRGRYAPRRTSVAVDAVAPASVSDMPAVDVLGKPRLHAGKYDLGAVENQSGGLLLMVK